VNGDGFDDVLIGAYFADPSGHSSGASYLVFGKAGGFTANVNLSALNGTNGFQINGEAAEDRSGRSVSAAGDVNGDGFDDILIGAHLAPHPYSQQNFQSGASYVVFGKGNFSATAGNLNLSALAVADGFQISGVAVSDFSGSSVSDAGDVNGDGLADLIIGAYGADPNGSYSGANYVVFGKKTGGFGANLDLSGLDGNNGFKLSGEAVNDFSGRSVSNAGDVNGDGFDDLLIGAAPFANPNNALDAGASYVVFGNTTAALDALHGASGFNLSALDGTNGFKLSGEAADDESGFSVSAAGDVNGDGFADIIIGAPFADANGNFSGASYVVFGNTTAALDLLHGASGFNLANLDGTNGFKISGAAVGDRSGWSVSGAGDVNGDGFDDIIIGAPFADPTLPPNRVFAPGSSYVVFGKAGGFAANLNLASLDGTNGVKLVGTMADDKFGVSVGAAGDVNGDGFDDVVIGAYSTSPNGAKSGASFVVFGANTGQVDVPGTSGNDMLTGNGNANILIGGLGNDTLNGGAGNDRLTGGLGNDTLVGGLDNDLYRINRGDGHDTIQENDSTLGNSDKLLYGDSISRLNLVLSRQVDDLRIAVHGSSDQVTIQNWYLSPDNQVETIQAGGQTLLNTQVAGLIQAMATFTGTKGGITWDQAIDQDPQGVQAVLAANGWHNT
jgi:hypothetical protein